MVLGFVIEVTAIALIYQWAEIARMARGRGSESPSCCQASVNLLISIVFMGLPWPMNTLGIVVISTT